MGASRNTRPSAENVRDANSGTRHRGEVQKPSTYAPAGFHQSQPQPPPQSYGNGTVHGTGHRTAHILMQQQDQRRPTTSGSNSGLPREGSVPVLPSTTRPHRLHHRSQSDLPLSPSQGGFSEQQRWAQESFLNRRPQKTKEKKDAILEKRDPKMQAIDLPLQLLFLAWLLCFIWYPVLFYRFFSASSCCLLLLDLDLMPERCAQENSQNKD
jgi:hypothetical protein